MKKGSNTFNKKLLWWERANLQAQLQLAPIGIDDETNARYIGLIRRHGLQENGGKCTLTCMLEAPDRQLFMGNTEFPIPVPKKLEWIIHYTFLTRCSGIFIWDKKGPLFNMGWPFNLDGELRQMPDKWNPLEGGTGK